MLKTKVVQISDNNDVCCIEFSSAHGTFFMTGLELPPNLKVGSEVLLNFKSNDVIISLEKFRSCSVLNELQAAITDINIGEILSVIALKSGDFEFESIISTISAKRLNLRVDTNVYGYIKSTSVSISKIYD